MPPEHRPPDHRPPEHRQDRGRLARAYEARASDLDEINDRSPWHRLHRLVTAEHLAALRPPVPTAVDLASGTGLTAELLCDLGYAVTAVETLPVMLAILRRKAAGQAIEVVDFDLLGDGELGLSGFGLATCTQALNFFPRLDPVFARARDSLRENGLLYVDIDTSYRWAVIEAMAGRPSNAMAILDEGVDAGRQIVGADYFFHSRADIVTALEQHGFTDITVEGILPVAPLLHILHESADFLDRPGLVRAATHYASDDGFAELRRLDTTVGKMMPAELCGYMTITATRRQ
ncbi:methyltransferase domain-containing protein [Actinoplanes sp. NPDC026619]|uniref:class I SAM-dependent DNA methyltransferase n=1 Tax=Actinoplanes sp. NPDC026619 TaxID=3155798 RepID=UPI0033C8D7D6